MVSETLGRVVNVTADGRILVSAPANLPAKSVLGRWVEDARHENAGRIRDVIGPVAAPLAVVEPAPGVASHRLVGRDVYLSTKRFEPRAHHRPYRSGGARRGSRPPGNP
jgi:rRNA processing protein Gar1